MTDEITFSDDPVMDDTIAFALGYLKEEQWRDMIVNANDAAEREAAIKLCKANDARWNTHHTESILEENHG